MSTDHNGSYCAVKGKMCLTEDEASRILRQLDGMTKYQCPECGQWHLGHKKSKSKARTYNRNHQRRYNQRNR